MTPVKTGNLVKLRNLSYGANHSGNHIVHADNREALSLLSATFKGKVKCIYLDPPYNNGETYSHYNDSRQHHDWIAEISETLRMLEQFLSKDGSIWISIDDREMHYLKVAADDIFGRENFITTVIWQQRSTRENRKVFSCNHEYILVYAKNPRLFKAKRNLLPLTPEVLERYKNPDNDKRGPWQSVSANVQAGHATPAQFYNLAGPSGVVFSPPKGRCWVYNENRMKEEISRNNIWFGVDGRSAPRIKKFLNGAAVGLTPETLWLASDAGTNESAKKHILSLLPDEAVFDTPKPEELLKRIFDISTNKGERVMDCYLGSGSAISAAHKMGRKYIGIEVGNHIVDLVAKRMRMVVDGEVGGISKVVGWKGGGGFDFYKIQSGRKRNTLKKALKAKQK